MPRLPHQFVAMFAFLAILLGYAVMAFNFPIAYIWATYEDLVGEWAQTYLFLAAAVLAGAVAMHPTRYRWFFVCFALAGLYVVLEEISWGQRVFGFATPDILKDHNLQGEANLHNLFTGPYKTLLKDALSIAVAIGLLVYGVLLPFALRQRRRAAVWLDTLGVAAPPLALWPLFCTAAWFELKPLSFNEAEIAELLVALAVSMTALHYLFAFRRGVSPVDDYRWGRIDSMHLGRWSIMMMVGVLALAAVTTVSFYASPANRAMIDGRIERGVEKFASRYVRYDRCDIAVDLYLRVLEDDPARTSLLRRIARCFDALGDGEDFRYYVQRAIEVDLDTLSRDPWRASVHRSLVRSYRLIDEYMLAEEHLTQALEIAYGRVEEHPDSASAAYSLGQAFALAGRNEEALREITRAYKADRSSSRYRGAYYAARRQLSE